MSHALITGPIKGAVVLPDGTEVDVTPEVILLDTLEEAQAVAHAIGLAYTENGHPKDPTFEYHPEAGDIPTS